MLNKNKAILFIAFLPALFVTHLVFAGDGSARKLVQKGDAQFIKSHLAKAQQYYLKALAIDSTDSYTNFQVGAIYYLSDSIKVKSLPYFLKTIKYSGPGIDDTIIDAYYYIGNCYALLKNYNAAIAAFNKYLPHVNPKSKVDDDILTEVRHDIKIYTDAPVIINRNSDSVGYLLDSKLHPVYVKNAGGTLNSPYPEYAQVLMNHDSTIIFTSRRPASQNGKKDFMTDEYYEDIFISHKDSGKWQTPTVFSNELHFSSSQENLASVTITSDGNTLFIYHNGRIWESHVSKGVWSKPEKIEKNIRQIERYIPSVFISFDGKKLFLVSDRNGGYGGKDIYESEKSNDGTWTEPQSLGNVINTPFDEDAPFLMPDNKTLFFSSNGHSGLGGYDIFKSVLENGKWSTPVNLGAPINSPADDIYFTYDSVLKEGYFSSSRVSGYGNMDIYSFSFTCDNIDNTILQGEVVSNGKPLSGATVSLTDTKHSNKTYSSQSDANGKYSVSLKPENTYNIAIKIPGYLPYYTTISIPHQCDAFNLYQVINTSFVTDSSGIHTGQSLAVKNAFYRNVKTGNYKNALSDPTLSALIHSYNDTSKIWERDTNATITYTKAQKDSMNRGRVIPTNIDSLHLITGPAIPGSPLVYFAFNKYNIKKVYYSKLDSLARFAKLNKKYKIQIEGNTDTVGSVAYNQHLSILRAKSVAKYLENKGVSAKRIHIQGNGKHHLAVVGDGSSALNRRDDIIIVQ
jgi:outer membrane protein OmpA-like peptidoglycan-associated protein/tetratricopeptide (TPR) repeat protein